jgi:hypothetical protein
MSRRVAYQRELKLNEKGPKRPIVYTEVTWVHTHYAVQKCWLHSHFAVQKCWHHEEAPGVVMNRSAGRR